MGTVTNGGVIQKMFIPLPMSTAVYNDGSLQHYRRNDWQGSVRVASTPSKTLFSGTAYGAFGESYASTGTPNNQFAGLTSDISSGTEQVSLSRRYHPGQGRWISPDGGIPNLLNPQTFNAYHYALNQPTNIADAGGSDDDNQTTENQDAAIDLGNGAYSIPEDPSVTQDQSIIANIQNSGVDFTLNALFNAGDSFGAGAVDVSGGGYGAAGGASGSWDSGTSGFHGGMGISYGGSADLSPMGPAFGGMSTGSVGGGLFSSRTNISAGRFTSGGAAIFGGPFATGAPQQTQGTTVAAGAYLGAGLSVFITNARSVQQLQGPFATYTFNVGAGPIKFSAQFSTANGIWQASFGPPIPYLSPGIGVSFSKMTTDTCTAWGC
jgi:RHS repeat-associated protein